MASDPAASAAALNELLPFLDPTSHRLDLKTVALQHVLGLTGSAEGIAAILASDGKSLKMLKFLLALTGDESESVAKDAALALINVSADAAGASALAGMGKEAVGPLWARVENKDCGVADPACMALSNLTVTASDCAAVAEALKEVGAEMDKVVRIFCQQG